MSYVLPTPEQRQRTILESHRRSRLYGLDPDMGCAPEHSRLNAAQLKERVAKNATLLELCTSQMNMLLHILADNIYCMALADSDGYILHVVGHNETLAQYKRRKCVPGYRWTERDMGTCAIGLVLHEQNPVLLLGEEMFRVSHITNSAAPIFDPGGKLIGVFTLSGPAEKMHMHSLGLVVQAALAIRLQMVEQENSRTLAIHNQFMKSLQDSDHRGIVTLDRAGRLVQMNNKAKQFLGLSDKDIQQPLDRLVVSDVAFTDILAQGRGFTERELTCKRRGRTTTHIATLDPIILPDGEVAGGMLLIMEKKRMFSIVSELAGLTAHFTFDAIIGNHPTIRDTVRLAQIAAEGNSTVLLHGPTGTGKELFAQAIHNASSRRGKSFVVINCGAIPKELLESELFGYEEGSFTGAVKGGRPGKLELANGGTLFLDEIGDMPPDMQVKILRVLNSGEIHRLGGSVPLNLDLRVIAATNVDLKDAIARRAFREDLYYRIATLTISIPALKDREDDVVLLAHFFLNRLMPLYGKEGMFFSESAVRAMRSYVWPGNIRQLENAVERAVNITSGKSISPADLDLPCEESEEAEALLPLGGSAPESLREAEARLIRQHMQYHGNTISKVAQALGITRPTLYKKLRAHGLPER